MSIDYKKRLNRVFTYIETHLDKDISLNELADVACFSAYHFHRIFLGMTGETVKTYIRRLKIQEAAKNLIYSGKSVTEIAFEAGHETVESFIRSFKKYYDLSPLKYRKSVRDYKQKCSCRIILDLKLKEKTMKVEIKERAEQTVAFIRHVGPYEKCNVAWEKICTWAGPKGLLQNTSFLGICHDDPEITDPQKIRYDASIVVPKGTKPEGEVGIKEIHAGKYASIIHKGSYKNLKDTYAYIFGKWAVDNNVEFGDPSLEIYINSPRDTKEADLLTEIQIPLK